MVRVPESLAAVGEHRFLAKLLKEPLRARGVVVGPGHDCAIVEMGRSRWLLTVDCLVEGIHFRTGWLTPRQLGRRAMAVNASDIAAMGGAPRFALVNFAVPGTYSAAALRAIQGGIVEAAAQCGAVVVGGNLSAARELGITVSLIGAAPRRLVSRTGAQPGDRIFVTGHLGDAALAIAALLNGRRPSAAVQRRYASPTPRLHAGALLSSLASAMIDVSDGLIQDLGHICCQSGVAACVESARIPVSESYRRLAGADMGAALSGGEDFELLCTIPPSRVSRLRSVQAELGVEITEIGAIGAGRGVKIVAANGTVAKPARRGYDHFVATR